jgi:hypothetical protein
LGWTFQLVKTVVLTKVEAMVSKLYGVEMSKSNSHWFKVATIERKTAKEIDKWRNLTGVLTWEKRKVKGKTILEVFTDASQINLNGYKNAKKDLKSLMK